jgi:hypothetical protein
MNFILGCTLHAEQLHIIHSVHIVNFMLGCTMHAEQLHSVHSVNFIPVCTMQAEQRAQERPGGGREPMHHHHVADAERVVPADLRSPAGAVLPHQGDVVDGEHGGRVPLHHHGGRRV